ncbi:hypothetical protein DFR86_11595 [Acidianus sulfidivorans JP7]|uniref:Helicase ATP-binding domain-containing protein n=2 Tax=Acidianus TaxID=12914 RepID=A0A2U9IQ67_9CREN|nr:hypothetical protein DFR86_11595 [Acidianus sulfidivorans JP7]
MAKRVQTWPESGGAETGRYSMPDGLQELSLSIMDDVHLIQDEVFLGPRVLAKIIADIAASGGFIIISSATLPDAFIQYIEEEAKRRGVNYISKKVSKSKPRNVLKLGEELTADKVECRGKTLVIANSVVKARDLSKGLEEKCKGFEVLT